ncbi:ATP-binding cassette domain-containing protein [Bacillaceae bacterium Marseille-Q3522]|nr:ATP-binding cassette domain-containing protein [Bacillaceae bacterium Marseille-Q3522]
MQQDRLVQQINTLSLGERIRIKLTGMLLSDYDILVLDEPTNHLDLPSRERMEDTLSTYKGTLLLVSHDLYFLNKLTNKLLIIENQAVKRVETGFQHYEKKQHRVEAEGDSSQLLLINNRITALISEISLLTPSDPKYQELDTQLTELLKRKKQLENT